MPRMIHRLVEALNIVVQPVGLSLLDISIAKVRQLSMTLLAVSKPIGRKVMADSTSKPWIVLTILLPPRPILFRLPSEIRSLRSLPLPIPRPEARRPQVMAVRIWPLAQR